MSELVKTRIQPVWNAAGREPRTAKKVARENKSQPRRKEEGPGLNERERVDDESGRGLRFDVMA